MAMVRDVAPSVLIICMILCMPYYKASLILIMIILCIKVVHSLHYTCTHLCKHEVLQLLIPSLLDMIAFLHNNNSKNNCSVRIPTKVNSKGTLVEWSLIKKNEAKNKTPLSPDVETNAKHTFTSVLLISQKLLLTTKYSIIPRPNITICTKTTRMTSIETICEVAFSSTLIAQYPPSVAKVALLKITSRTIIGDMMQMVSKIMNVTYLHSNFVLISDSIGLSLWVLYIRKAKWKYIVITVEW